MKRGEVHCVDLQRRYRGGVVAMRGILPRCEDGGEGDTLLGELMAGADARLWMTCNFFLSAARRLRILATTVCNISLVTL